MASSGISLSYFSRVEIKLNFVVTACCGALLIAFVPDIPVFSDLYIIYSVGGSIF